MSEESVSAMTTDKPDFYETYGVERIINAAGTLTALGASPVREDVISEIVKVLSKSVVIDSLQDTASEGIADVTGAEAGFVTACAAAGITLGVAACMTGVDVGNVLQLPDTTGLKSEVILQKGHAVNFGAIVTQMIRLAGAQPLEIGSANGCSGMEMEAAITEQTAAALFVVSPHTVQHGIIPFRQFVDIAHSHDVPVVVDAAAEYTFAEFVTAGADLVTCSGHKFLFGPTSGLVAGRRELIQACRLQSRGIGRTMKVGKEGIVGLIAALRAWHERDLDTEHERTKAKARRVAGRLGAHPGINAVPVEDLTGNPVTRVLVDVDPGKAGLDAFILTQELRRGSPPIATRAHHADRGIFRLDMRFLTDQDIDIVCERIQAIVDKSEGEKEKLWRTYRCVGPDRIVAVHPSAREKEKLWRKNRASLRDSVHRG